MNGSRLGTAICVDSIAIVICLWLISVFQRIGDLRK